MQKLSIGNDLVDLLNCVSYPLACIRYLHVRSLDTSLLFTQLFCEVQIIVFLVYVVDVRPR